MLGLSQSIFLAAAAAACLLAVAGVRAQVLHDLGSFALGTNSESSAAKLVNRSELNGARHVVDLPSPPPSFGKLDNQVPSAKAGVSKEVQVGANGLRVSEEIGAGAGWSSADKERESLAKLDAILELIRRREAELGQAPSQPPNVPHSSEANLLTRPDETEEFVRYVVSLAVPETLRLLRSRGSRLEADPYGQPLALRANYERQRRLGLGGLEFGESRELELGLQGARGRALGGSRRRLGTGAWEPEQRDDGLRLRAPGPADSSRWRGPSLRKRSKPLLDPKTLALIVRLLQDLLEEQRAGVDVKLTTSGSLGGGATRRGAADGRTAQRKERRKGATTTREQASSNSGSPSQSRGGEVQPAKSED